MIVPTAKADLSARARRAERKTGGRTGRLAGFDLPTRAECGFSPAAETG